MKKLMIVLIAGIYLAVFPSGVFAHYEEYKNNIKDGAVIMATSPKPFIEAMQDEYVAAKFKPFGVAGGLLKGTYNGVKQLLTGAVRILTFNMGDDNVFLNFFKK